MPSVRATWAPRADPGHLPPLRLEADVDGHRARLRARRQRRPAHLRDAPGAYNDDSLIEFLAATHDLLNGRKVTLTWDSLPSHRSKKMTAWTDTQASWLRVERRPGYAHELNPVRRPAMLPRRISANLSPGHASASALVSKLALWG